MKAWQIVSIGKGMVGRAVICIAGSIAMLKMGPMVMMALSMLISIAIYAVAFGLQFAVGFVLLLFAHEYGHLIASRVAGIKVSNPIFIPFIGAVIRIKELPRNAKIEANIAIGGPAMGTLSALVCLACYLWTNSMLMLVLSYTACLLNLFNLIPCDPLDGGRIAAAISPRLWWLGSIVMGILFVYTYNFFVFIILIFSLFRLWKNDTSAALPYYQLTTSQRLAVGWWYFGLVIVLGGTTLYISGMLN
ncbi:MAG: site-2 protease family protein [Sporomusaceae bacterium]|nr:site-2 protease family protein [Sporomusaceae bacterium]